MIGRGGERGSRISVLTARQDDDDDDINVKNCKCRFLGDRHEKVTHIIIKSSKLSSKENKTRR